MGIVEQVIISCLLHAEGETPYCANDHLAQWADPIVQVAKHVG